MRCHISPRNEPLAFDRTAAAPSQAALTQRLSPGSDTVEEKREREIFGFARAAKEGEKKGRFFPVLSVGALSAEEEGKK